MAHKTIERARISARKFEKGPLQFKAKDVAGAWRDLNKLGIDLGDAVVRDMMQNLGVSVMDAADVTPSPLPGLTTPSISAPIQFLQAWLPGFVQIITQARKIDEILGMSAVGDWEDEEIVQGTMEQLGTAEPYSDRANVPLASYNAVWERRTIVRFEKGFDVGKLEEMRAARVRIDAASTKRASAAMALEIQRNNVGFYGYNDGLNRTYGLLNDPNMIATIPVTTGAGGNTWALKTYLEILADIRLGLKTLRVQSGDNIDPKTARITMVLSTDTIDYLSVTSQFGNSVQGWIDVNYPNLRVISCPQFIAAVGGLNVIYFFADEVADSGDDDHRTFVQMVPTKFMTLGVERKTKTYVEDFTNASAGIMLKRPYALVRMVGN